jgi:transposase-like protein
MRTAALALLPLPGPPLPASAAHLTSSSWRSAGTCASACPTATSKSSSPSAGVEVDHVTVYRWVQRFTPLLAEAARPCRHAVGDRWQVDETYVNVAGQWRYVYRAIDQSGQIIDVLVSTRRDPTAAHRFFQRAIGTTKLRPAEVTTDQAPVYPAVLEELLPFAWHRTDQYANNRVEAGHGRLTAWLRPTRPQAGP